jgi:hypothetical protein
MGEGETLVSEFFIRHHSFKVNGLKKRQTDKKRLQGMKSFTLY